MNRLPTRAELAQLSKQAGELTLHYFRKFPMYEEKPQNQGLVTEADLASEALIKEYITQKYPAHHTLAEESGLSSALSAGNFCWIVDPLDGTNNFSKGHSYYCVSIAVGQVLSDGTIEPLVCAIHHPIEGTTYTAVRGQGAWKDDTLLKTTPLRPRQQGYFATGFSNNRNEKLSSCLRAIEILQNQSLGVRINGAAALDMAWTAAGVFDGFFEKPLAPWDFAAGVLLMRESGLKVTNFKGDDFRLIQDDNIVATHKEWHEDFLSIIRESF